MKAIGHRVRNIYSYLTMMITRTPKMMMKAVRVSMRYEISRGSSVLLHLDQIEGLSCKGLEKNKHVFARRGIP